MLGAVLVILALCGPAHHHHHHHHRNRLDCRHVQTMTTQWLCERERKR